MISEILSHIKFELMIRYRSLSSYLYFLLFCSLSVLMTLAAGGAFSGVTVDFGLGSRIWINSPLYITYITCLLSALSIFVIAPVFGQAICKDFVHKMDQIIFSSPIGFKAFLLGRFIGATLFMLIVLSSISLGLYIATFFPAILPSMIGPHHILAYVIPIYTFSLTNIFIFGSIFFFMGSVTKKMAPIYISATLLFLLWMTSGILLSNVDNEMIATLIDPMGLNAAGRTVRYWTVDQQNENFLLLEGYLLWNRILWLSVAFVALCAGIVKFNTNSSMKANKFKRKKSAISKLSTLAKPLSPLSRSESQAVVFLKQLQFEFFQTVKSIYFLVILMAGVGYMFVGGTQIGSFYGTKTYPVTYNVLDFTNGSFTLFMLVILSLYAGESIWRDRDLKVNQIIDATPVKDSTLFFAKLFNLILVTLLLLTTVLFSGIIIQLAYGYTHFEMGQYLTRLYLIEFPSYLNFVSITIFFHVILRNKLFAHAAVVLTYMTYVFAPSFGFEHYLYRFNAKPFPMYSDMNGFGHFFRVFHIYNTYWLFFSGFLLLIAYLFWQRGPSSFDGRLNLTQIMPRFNLRTRAGLLLFPLCFVIMGTYIFYQSNIINEYETKKDREKKSYDYEKKYKKYEKIPQPSLSSVYAEVDIYPSQMKMKSQLEMTFVNDSGSPVEEIFVHVAKKNSNLDIDLEAEAIEDKKHELIIFKLKNPLLPGGTFKGTYKVAVDESTIRNDSNRGNIFYNGTFFNNFDYFPLVGYLSYNELNERKTREKYGLKPKPRMPKIDDEQQRRFNYLGRYASWIDFEAIISTDEEQIAVAPGLLKKEWTENGRRYSHYKMDQKIINFYAFMSARYQVKTDKWNDVNIEVYYHPGHEYNVDRMIRSTKRSLDYFTEAFGPYQHKQYRIFEFPRYETFAQAFPNTIPFSEAIGFIARVDDDNEDDIDYPFYVNAHELAHQWWAHQLVGAYVQGAEMLSESFSQYSALMVMEKEYGKEKMKKFLKYELDKYLFGRGKEKEYENPLYLSERQSYIHYQKGSLVFYALRDYLGEKLLNSSIREFLQKHGKKGPPYPTSKDFIEILKDKTLPKYHALIEDLLEKIVIFDNRALLAEVSSVGKEKYEVKLEVLSKKYYSDENGKETLDKDFKQDIDIGFLDEEGEYIYLEKHPIVSGKNIIKLTLNEKPFKAGIDPLNILIDRNTHDNVKKVSFKSSKPSLSGDPAIKPGV